MAGPQDDSGLSAAELAFADYLAKHAEDPSADFETFCRDHPLQVKRLHELHSDWRRVSKLLEQAVRDDPRSAALEAHLLHSADPGIALDSDPGVPRQADPSALIHRLAGQRGREDRYPRLTEIARGGMGVIWQVWDQDLRRKLAMKIVRGRIGGLPKEKGDRVDARVLSRFLEEAQITAQLEHPGIVPVHDLGIDAQGNVYFTMSLVRGREFKEILQLAREGRDDWTLTRALGVILKVCEAVAYAHSKGVLHRDLKPANIMVGRFGETYVMDWGLARVMGRPDSHDLKPAQDLVSRSTSIRTERQEFKEHSPDSPLITKYGDVIGTPSYMAPEQAQGMVDNIGPQSDVYAIGAILYHLLCGQMPYVPKGARASHHTVLAAHLMGPPKPVLEIDPTAPPELADICAKAMSREPKRRYATALDMARDIENYLGHRPVSARPASLAYVARLAFKRHKAVASVAGLAAAALLMFGGFHYVQMGRTVVAKEAALAVSTRLADLNSARALIAQADEVFAPLPERVRRLDAWLGRVRELFDRKPAYERMAHADEASREAGEARELLAYVADLERLEPFRHEHRNDVLALEPALDSPEWRAACDDIASSPVYAGLKLAPQWGLEPLQKNPVTGLWEFWCPLSGERPRIANAANGELAAEAKMAVVLVLLPGGKFVMGSPTAELDGVIIENERQHEELVAPFFAAKYEVSQAQWRSLMGDNPAYYAASDLNPVESVSALDSDEFARRLGAALPTEAQWEYACRGGRATAYWMGDEPASLRTENTLDASGAALALGAVSEWDDGQKLHAPIGFSGANPFGLFDVHGNVAEWCADSQPRPADPSAVRPRNFRGGSFVQPPQYCRAALRSWDNPKGLNHARGLRVARAIDP